MAQLMDGRAAARAPASPVRVGTGVTGLDEILNGGLPENRIYLIDGEPGTGKTTLALQFLLAGTANGGRGLYVTLSETKEELEAVASSYGWSLDGIDMFELAATDDDELAESYTIFHPAEVELHHTVEAVFHAIEEGQPTRVVFDSLSEMRLMARDPLRFRRQILALKKFFSGRKCTVLLLDDQTAPEGDLQLHSLAHGVIALEHVALEYGAERRRLKVTKVRGVPYRGGFHDFRIFESGIRVFPRIVQSEPRGKWSGEVLLSGSAPLDALLGGGVTRGSSVLITGAAGTGKSVLCTQYAEAALKRGERVAFYMFDERLATFRMRSETLGIGIADEAYSELLSVRQIEPTQLSPGEFANEVQRTVERDKVKLLVIDSINGYMQSMPEERLLAVQMHELLTFLANNGVTVIMTLVQRGIFGSPVDEVADISYLADTVILMRYFEVHGSVRQAISVVKKRSGDHEHTIREFRITKGGLALGEPLRDFQGVLTGVPQYMGSSMPLMHEQQPGATP